MGHLESGAAFVAEARAARRNTLATIGRPDQIVRKRDVTRRNAIGSRLPSVALLVTGGPAPTLGDRFFSLLETTGRFRKRDAVLLCLTQARVKVQPEPPRFGDLLLACYARGSSLRGDV